MPTSIKVPKLLDPSQASVLESQPEKLLRMLAQLIGGSDPASTVSDVAGMTGPIAFGSALGRRGFQQMGRRANMALPEVPIGKMPFDEQSFPVEVAVRVSFEDGQTFIDGVKGLNIGHALRRAASNWPSASDIKVLGARAGEEILGDVSAILDEGL